VGRDRVVVEDAGADWEVGDDPTVAREARVVATAPERTDRRVYGLPIAAYSREKTYVERVLAIVGDARGAFDVATDPPIDGRTLAELLDTRLVEVPRPLDRAGLAAAWRAHLVPADPALLDLVLELPRLYTTRARTELGWRSHSGATLSAPLWLASPPAAAGPLLPLPRRRRPPPRRAHRPGRRGRLTVPELFPGRFPCRPARQMTVLLVPPQPATPPCMGGDPAGRSHQ
jgi:hypothetical protein